MFCLWSFWEGVWVSDLDIHVMSLLPLTAAQPFGQFAGFCEKGGRETFMICDLIGASV